MSDRDFSESLKGLTPLQYRVIRENATESPFQNEYWDNRSAGIYVDRVSGEPLFSSLDKFDAHCGWPSFTRPLAGTALVEKSDASAGLKRVEVRSARSDSHLGHVFDDGPGESGLRYCINSAAIRFIPVSELEREGYGNYRTLFKAGKLERVIFGAGCFWGTEAYFSRVPGVTAVRCGYCGGREEQADYRSVCGGSTGHAETVELIYDSERVSFRALLIHFFRMHDPTTLNRQGNDHGTQYRSAIFYTTDEQRAMAETFIAELSQSGKFARPIVTNVSPALPFYPAEEYHQKYLEKNPGGYCHVNIGLAAEPVEEL